MIDNVFWWHNFIDGSGSGASIKEAVDYCFRVASMLAEAEEEGVITLTGGNPSPSLTHWVVSDREAYEQICSKYNLDPGDFEFSLPEFNPPEG